MYFFAVALNISQRINEIFFIFLKNFGIILRPCWKFYSFYAKNKRFFSKIQHKKQRNV